MHQIRLRLGLRPDPLGELTSKGPTLREGRDREREEKEGKGRRGWKGEGMEGEERRKGKEIWHTQLVGRSAATETSEMM